jgi:hypothetical protein
MFEKGVYMVYHDHPTTTYVICIGVLDVFVRVIGGGPLCELPKEEKRPFVVAEETQAV